MKGDFKKSMKIKFTTFHNDIDSWRDTFWVYKRNHDLADNLNVYHEENMSQVVGWVNWLHLEKFLELYFFVV